MKFLSLCLLTVLTFTQILAHEGHNHDAPKGLSPLKGGTIKPFLIEAKDGKKDQNCFVEVVKSKNDLKIYFFDSMQKNVDAKDFKVDASALVFSRGAKHSKDNGIALVLEDKKKFYLTSFDKKNAHKFDLILKFEGPGYCKASENISFIID